MPDVTDALESGWEKGVTIRVNKRLQLGLEIRLQLEWELLDVESDLELGLTKGFRQSQEQ